MLYYPGDKPFIFIASRYTQGGTNTADAIRYARDTSFTPQNGKRPHAAQIALIVTDGKHMTINEIRKQYHFPLKRLNTIVLALPIWHSD